MVSREKFLARAPYVLIGVELFWAGVTVDNSYESLKYMQNRPEARNFAEYQAIDQHADYLLEQQIKKTGGMFALAAVAAGLLIASRKQTIKEDATDTPIEESPPEPIPRSKKLLFIDKWDEKRSAIKEIEKPASTNFVFPEVSVLYTQNLAKNDVSSNSTKAATAQITAEVPY